MKPITLLQRYGRLNSDPGFRRQASGVSTDRVGRTFLSDKPSGAYAVGDKAMRKTALAIGLTLLCCLVSAQQIKDKSAKLSSLPAEKQLAINAAARRWGAQFKSSVTDDNQESFNRDTSVETVHLGGPEEADLVLIDPSSCSVTGNCSILVLRPVKNRYRVVLDGIGQTYKLGRVRRNGFQNIELVMHGSATMYRVKVYKFNGSRYFRSGCYDMNFTVLDSEGNVQDLDKPRMTPCRNAPLKAK